MKVLEWLLMAVMLPVVAVLWAYLAWSYWREAGTDPSELPEGE